MVTEIGSQSSLSLEDFTFVPRGQKQSQIRIIPTFLTGELGQTVFNIYEEVRREKYSGNRHLQLLYDGIQVIGSDFFDTVIVDNLVKRFGVRTPTLADLSNSDLMQAVKGDHYIDSRDLVLVSTKDNSDSRKNGIARELAERVNLSQGPVLMTGFTIEPWADDKEGYGLRVVPASDFAVIYDDRLSGKWNGYKFDTADANGLPVSLDKRKGSRTWYTRDNGLSRLCLGRNLDVDSNVRCLAFSDGDGRVALVDGEAARAGN